jgi:hypothetical protein
VIGSDIECGHFNSSRRVVELGKFVGDLLLKFIDSLRDVLKENERWLELLSKPRNFVEKSAALSSKPRLTSRSAEVLAWEAPVNNVDPTTQRVPLQSTHVIPDGGMSKLTAPHSRQQVGLSVSVALTVGDGPDPWLKGEREPSDSAK